MLEDELNVIIYLIAYPVSVIFNIFAGLISDFLGVFLNVFICTIDIINAFNVALHALVSVALPSDIATLVLIMFYILGIYYLIKLIKMVWDVLPFV